jgi:hypothetical protein
LFEVGPGDKRKSGRCFNCGTTFDLPMMRRRFYGIASVGFAVVLLVIVAAVFMI